jgi:hypothetical protein
MKEQYAKPVTKIDIFKTVDVITMSATIDDSHKGDTDINFGD